MERTTTRLGILTTALLCLAAPAAPETARARDDARVQVVVVSADDGTPAPLAAPQPTRPPRAPRAPRATTASPAVPAAPGMPAPAEAPEAPAADMDAPQPPGLVTPRGWFGFGFTCDECIARRAVRDSAPVWTFTSLPRVYSVDLGSPAARAGLQRGDVLARIDGVSILSPDGGRRFGRIQPGQSVRLTVVRDGAPRELVAQAIERPERRATMALLDLRGELSRLNGLTDTDQLRRQINELNREMERSRARDDARTRLDVRTYSTRRLRYAGVIGDAEVEVRGPSSVIVSQTGDNEMVITVGESVVRIHVPDSARKRTADVPR
jgi:PDZ domain-containing protein